MPLGTKIYFRVDSLEVDSLEVSNLEKEYFKSRLRDSAFYHTRMLVKLLRRIYLKRNLMH